MTRNITRPDFLEPQFSTSGVSHGMQAMADRVASQIRAGRVLTGPEKDFLLHEIVESELIDGGMTDLEAAHDEALRLLGASEQQLFSPEVISANPTEFSRPYFEYWGLQK